MKIAIARKKVEKSLEKWRQNLVVPFGESTPVFELPKATGFGNTVTLNTQTTPKSFLTHLLDDEDTLTEKQRAALHLAIHDAPTSIDMVCTKPNDVHTMVSGLKLKGGYNAEIELNGRWYLIKITSTYQPARERAEPYTNIQMAIRICDIMITRTAVVTEELFQDDAGEPIGLTGADILRTFGLRRVQQNLLDYEDKCSQARRFVDNDGKLVGVKNSVLIPEKQNYSLNVTEVDLGTPTSIKKAVLDHELETERNLTRLVDELFLPFVRAFSLDLKKWVYIDVEDITEYEFDANALNWLVLPPKEKSLLSKLFTSARGKMFGDVLTDKHGGMIILANGKTGVGKTLSAEIFAEMTKAPLYIMEMAELGISIEHIEYNLNLIFRRVTRWNAILLMDEADVFLAERDTDLTRSVIVGIFLRLMDYYHGLLFLTSNRAEVIDSAFKSRITIRIDYPELDQASRREIWKVMLHHAGLRPIISADRTVSQENLDLDEISQIELNGRQIRNMTRLVKVLFDGEVTTKDIVETCQFACK